MFSNCSGISKAVTAWAWTVCLEGERAPVLELSSHLCKDVCWDGRVCRLRPVEEDVLPQLT